MLVEGNVPSFGIRERSYEKRLYSPRAEIQKTKAKSKVLRLRTET